ncbi:FAD-dependent oxidoreductase [Streptomyces sp. NBC_01092]|uniref:FAD-dependent oxidoreductase n=1 Tax=Streptomyces sp. NBC_01092 TaxID=2903748 RepID=UPI00386C7AA9|nr:FAD-dependent oxidoreductase [Streptomyces sp. NBC_01092]
MAGSRIAVVGSGIAGLAAAWACARSGNVVTVFEAHDRCGMDAHTAEVSTAGGSATVDVPLRIVNPAHWTHFLALCREAGVSTYEVDAGLSFSTMSGHTWLRAGRVQESARWGLGSGMLRHPGPAALRVAYGAIRLSRELDRGIAVQGIDEPTLDQFMSAKHFDPFFYIRFVLPILSTICTCSQETLRNWPAMQVLELLRTILLGPRAQRLQGGTTALVSRLAERVDVRTGEGVTLVSPDANGVTVLTATGTNHRFDYVVVATQANQTTFLDPVGCRQERAVLKRFPYERGTLITHSDTRFLPRQRKHWMPLNYLLPAGQGEATWTVWLNRVEPALHEEAPVLQTWQAPAPPAVDSVHSKVVFERSVVTKDTAAALSALHRLHGDRGRRVFFCGSYAAPGVPLLETATRSAIAVSERLGAGTEWGRRAALIGGSSA